MKVDLHIQNTKYPLYNSQMYYILIVHVLICYSGCFKHLNLGGVRSCLRQFHTTTYLFTFTCKAAS